MSAIRSFAHGEGNMAADPSNRLSFILNGAPVTVADPDPRKTLLDYLRSFEVGLTGPRPAAAKAAAGPAPCCWRGTSPAAPARMAGARWSPEGAAGRRNRTHRQRLPDAALLPRRQRGHDDRRALQRARHPASDRTAPGREQRLAVRLLLARLGDVDACPDAPRATPYWPDHRGCLRRSHLPLHGLSRDPECHAVVRR